MWRQPGLCPVNYHIHRVPEARVMFRMSVSYDWCQKKLHRTDQEIVKGFGNKILKVSIYNRKFGVVMEHSWLDGKGPLFPSSLLKTDPHGGHRAAFFKLLGLWLIIKKTSEHQLYPAGLGFSLFSIFTFKETKETLNEQGLSAITGLKNTDVSILKLLVNIALG